MIFVILKELGKRYPHVTFSILSPCKVFIPSELELKVRFIKLKPIRILHEILSSSIFIVGGGTQIHDKGVAPKKYIRLVKLFLLVLAAKISLNKIYFMGIGIEPLETGKGRILAKYILKLADHISVRDNSSSDNMKSLGIKPNNISFDLAALLLLYSKSNNEKNSQNIYLLGISIMPFFEIYLNDKNKDLILIKELAKALKCWLDLDPKNKIQLFTFKGKSIDDDCEITNRLKEELNDSDRVSIIPYIDNPMAVLFKISQCGLFIGMRYHSCLFAFLAEIPLLVIDYFDKCSSLAKDIGLPPQSIISPEKILAGNFEEQALLFFEHKNHFKSELPLDQALRMASSNFDIKKVT